MTLRWWERQLKNSSCWLFLSCLNRSSSVDFFLSFFCIFDKIEYGLLPLVLLCFCLDPSIFSLVCLDVFGVSRGKDWLVNHSLLLSHSCPDDWLSHSFWFWLVVSLTLIPLTVKNCPFHLPPLSRKGIMDAQTRMTPYWQENKRRRTTKMKGSLVEGRCLHSFFFTSWEEIPRVQTGHNSKNRDWTLHCHLEKTSSLFPEKGFPSHSFPFFFFSCYDCSFSLVYWLSRRLIEVSTLDFFSISSSLPICPFTTLEGNEREAKKNCTKWQELSAPSFVLLCMWLIHESNHQWDVVTPLLHLFRHCPLMTPWSSLNSMLFDCCYCRCVIVVFS